MEGRRVSEEWEQAPEVQSHQLRKLCGANAGVKRWGLRISLQRGERERCGCIPFTNATVNIQVRLKQLFTVSMYLL